MKILIFILFISIICISTLSQTIHVMSYDYSTTVDCIEDWIVPDIVDYEGAYTFIHFGHHTYNVSISNGIVSVEELFESLNAKERSFLKNAGISGNNLTAEISPWETFKARFVKLKCDIDQSILKGFKGLLVNKELLYIVIGD